MVLDFLPDLSSHSLSKKSAQVCAQPALAFAYIEDIDP
jgi:hypothetical protein